MKWRLNRRGKPTPGAEQPTPFSTLRDVGRSDTLRVVTFKMSNQRRALQAVQMLRQAGYTGANIDHTRPVELEVFIDVPVRIGSQNDVERLVRETDPQSTLIPLPTPDLPDGNKLDN